MLVWNGATHKLQRSWVIVGFFVLAMKPAGFANDQVVLVLGSSLAPYLQAQEGFLENSDGLPVERRRVDENLMTLPGCRVVVAIGGKAAIKPYPSNVAVVAILAPGITEPTHPVSQFVRIRTIPSPKRLLETLKRLPRPNDRIGMLSMSKNSMAYGDELLLLGRQDQLSIQVEALDDPSDLPQMLRKLAGRLDTLWVPPDPLLLTPQSFELLKEFATSNKIVLWVPTHGLVMKGAAGSLAPSFREMGKEAARVVKSLQQKQPVDDEIYPQISELAVNAAAFKEINRKLPGEWNSNLVAERP